MLLLKNYTDKIQKKTKISVLTAQVFISIKYYFLKKKKKGLLKVWYILLRRKQGKTQRLTRSYQQDTRTKGSIG